jgi:hypothetical protein
VLVFFFAPVRDGFVCAEEKKKCSRLIRRIRNLNHKISVCHAIKHTRVRECQTESSSECRVSTKKKFKSESTTRNTKPRRRSALGTQSRRANGDVDDDDVIYCVIIHHSVAKTLDSDGFDHQ